MDDAAKHLWAIPTVSKSNIALNMVALLKTVQRKTGMLPLVFTSDQRTQFLISSLRSYFESVGSSHESSSVDFPGENGLAENIMTSSNRRCAVSYMQGECLLISGLMLLPMPLTYGTEFLGQALHELLMSCSMAPSLY